MGYESEQRSRVDITVFEIGWSHVWYLYPMGDQSIHMCLGPKAVIGGIFVTKGMT